MPGAEFAFCPDGIGHLCSSPVYCMIIDMVDPRRQCNDHSSVLLVILNVVELNIFGIDMVIRLLN